MRWASSLVVSISFAMLCAGQASAPAPGNPRTGADDPRVGLKGGLYDAGEAAFGLERLASLPKPPGFAPGDATSAPAPPPAPGGPPAAPAAASQYGSTNSDLAFSGNHLFVGNYNGINFYDIDNPAKTK